MPSWADLRNEFEAQPNDQAKLIWLDSTLQTALRAISDLQGGRNVIFYASGFLQKPQSLPLNYMVALEDINGLMSVMHGMDCALGLTLILHTPGGDPSAANAIVAYLHSKFSDITAVVPTYAMSAGTMIALGANRVVMGRQSQLGPIDAQMNTRNGPVSAGAMLDTFQQARTDIIANNGLAHLWHPILQTMGPSLLREAANALEFGERMVAGWLESRMFAGQPNAGATAKRIAEHFNATTVHKNHARRIDRAEARAQGVVVEDLEPTQELQEAVLTAYHVAQLNFTVTKAVKIVANSRGINWQKNVT